VGCGRAAGEPFTPEYVLPAGVQTGGRFDPGDVPTLYLALDEPAHALAEVLQDLRGRRGIREGHLRRRDRRTGRFHPLALVDCHLAAELFLALPDLGDPQVLVSLGIRPDDLAARDRNVTQEIARTLHRRHRLPGFRWWSAFGGEWHVAVVFLDRVLPAELRYGPPEALHLAHAVVHAAAAELRVGAARPAARRVLPTETAASARRSPPAPPNP
jgi:hypothetical protein